MAKLPAALGALSLALLGGLAWEVSRGPARAIHRTRFPDGQDRVAGPPELDPVRMRLEIRGHVKRGGEALPWLRGDPGPFTLEDLQVRPLGPYAPEPPEEGCVDGYCWWRQEGAPIPPTRAALEFRHRVPGGDLFETAGLSWREYDSEGRRSYRRLQDDELAAWHRHEFWPRGRPEVSATLALPRSSQALELRFAGQCLARLRPAPRSPEIRSLEVVRLERAGAHPRLALRWEFGPGVPAHPHWADLEGVSPTGKVRRLGPLEARGPLPQATETKQLQVCLLYPWDSRNDLCPAGPTCRTVFSRVRLRLSDGFREATLEVPVRDSPASPSWLAEGEQPRQ